METISVIIPVYRVEKYLRTCVDSVLSQRYAELDVILVDDGSPDGCPVMCDEYASKDSRVRVIHKSNGGLSDARNAGLDIAHGSCITFIDSDDYISPDYIGQLYEAMVNTGADMSVSGTVGVDEASGRQIDVTSRICDNAVFTPGQYLEHILYERLLVTAWGKLFSAQVFDGIRFPVGMLFEDVGTTYKAIGRCQKIAFTPEPKYNYLMRTGSITGSSFSDIKLASTAMHIEFYRFIDDIYPAMLPAAKYFVFKNILWLLSSVARGRDNRAKKSQLKQMIKPFKWSVLCNKNADKKIRLLAFISLFGFDFSCAFIRLIKRIRSRRM